MRLVKSVNPILNEPDASKYKFGRSGLFHVDMTVLFKCLRY